MIGATHNDYKTAVELIMNVANDSLSLSDVSAALTHTHTHTHRCIDVSRTAVISQ